MTPLHRGGCVIAPTPTENLIPRQRDGRRSLQLAALAVALTLVLGQAAPVTAQGPSAGNDDVPAEVREHYAQIIRAQAVLIQIPQMLMQDEVLKAEHQAYREALMEAMVAQDAATTRRLERFDDLQRQAESSPGGQGALLQEGRQLRDSLLATAASALSRASVTAAAKPLIASLTTAFERLEGVDTETLSIVTDEKLLLEAVTTMTVFGR